MKITNYQTRRYHQVREEFINEFYHGNEDFWNTRKQPYMSFKHLWRHLVDKYLIPIKSHQAKLEGVHHSTITHTFYNPNINLHPQLRKTAEDFLTKQLKRDPQTHVKFKMQGHLAKGLTRSDIARKYMVHPEVVDNVLDSGPVGMHSIQYVFKQMDS